MNEQPHSTLPNELAESRKAHWIGTSGFLSALAVSTCCILPLVLVSLCISGAWIGQLSVLSPYQPIFIAPTVLCLSYMYWLVYRKPSNFARTVWRVHGRCPIVW